jgi:hypothetical protein
MTHTMEYTETLTVTSCWCGINVAIPDNLYSYARRKKSYAIYCPLGHTFVFNSTTEERLAQEREKSARLQARLDQADASLIAQRAATTRVKNKLKRVEAGVCPQCNRTFQNLARHMKSKHTHEHGVKG